MKQSQSIKTLSFTKIKPRKFNDNQKVHFGKGVLDMNNIVRALTRAFNAQKKKKKKKKKKVESLSIIILHL